MGVSGSVGSFTEIMGGCKVLAPEMGEWTGLWFSTSLIRESVSSAELLLLSNSSGSSLADDPLGVWKEGVAVSSERSALTNERDFLVRMNLLVDPLDCLLPMTCPIRSVLHSY